MSFSDQGYETIPGTIQMQEVFHFFRLSYLYYKFVKTNVRGKCQETKVTESKKVVKKGQLKR